ncbi:MAG: U32 family peptidase [Clostridia bacterium]|nr:U32 family peptidase [Clostridia bacterium]
MMVEYPLPELLAPAGSMDQLKTALHFGADAVYGGMTRYGLRAFAGNFTEETLPEAVRLCHEKGARMYLTLNIFPFDEQMDGLVNTARFAAKCGVDAVIVSDLGAICALREEVPELDIHVSTQASTVNSRAVQMYGKLGCRRVILAREMSLEQMRVMRERIDPGMELETFVHGAACVAWSGRCLLSAVMTGRSGNQGACAQSCRWKYHVVEEKRPGEYMPVFEDNQGTYVFSAHDLNLMPYLDALWSAGISSLKIEGRMKTEYYTATVTLAYRQALDLMSKDPEAYRAAVPQFLEALACASHRVSDTGFLLGKPKEPGGAEGFHQSREYIARCLSDTQAGDWTPFLLKNRFCKGDKLELMTPGGIIPLEAPSMRREKTGEILDTFGVGGEVVSLQLPVDAHAWDMLRGPVRNHRA